jgi:hypothetical protein
MNCIASAIIGIGLLFATFSTMTISEETNDFLRKEYGPDLTNIYNNIVTERRNIYLQGLILGIVLALFTLFLYRTKNMFHRIMLSLAIITSVSVIYYTLMPKSDYMLRHLKTPDQAKSWLTVYSKMKGSYVMGFILGSLVAIPVSLIFC